MGNNQLGNIYLYSFHPIANINEGCFTSDVIEQQHTVSFAEVRLGDTSESIIMIIIVKYIFQEQASITLGGFQGVLRRKRTPKIYRIKQQFK